MSDEVTLDGRSLDIPALERVALLGAPVAIAPAASRAMARGRALVDRYVREGIPAYGINTGLGARATEALPEAELAEFSLRMVRGRAQGVGPPLTIAETRAVMLARLNTLLTGEAGASPAVAAFLVEALNRNLAPVVPRWASIGAGDLVAMAAIPHAFIGEGEMWRDGAAAPAAEVLAAAGTDPLVLGPKDGLVLTNITAFSVGQAALAAGAARRALEGLFVAGALSFEGFRGNATPISEGATRVRPQAGEVAAGERLRALLQGGLLLDPGHARRLQDPLSFRCLAQVLGSCLAQYQAVEAAVAVELNSSADNPAVLIEEERVVSTGNFHTPHLSLVLDGLSRALAWAATDCVSRIARLMNPTMSGLPPLLSSEATGRAGFGPLMKPIEALRGEILHLANPVPILPSHNADGVEDSLTFTALAARKLSDLVERLELLIGFELIAGAQAVDLARPAIIGTELQAVKEKVRKVSPFLDKDRPVAKEVTALAALVRSGKLVSGE
ncbi:MAG: histidine ammonia-lyase [Parvibaculaceae bacterium]